MSHSRRGFSLIELLVVIAIIAVLAGLLVAAVQAARAAADRANCANNLRQLGIGLLQFHDSNLKFPPGLTSAQPDKPFANMSWLTRLLPFVEQQALWQATVAAYDAEPSPINFPPHIGLALPVQFFGCPSDVRVSGPQITPDGDRVALTSYLGVLGTDYTKADGVLFLDSWVRMKMITDGTSQTLMAGERPPSADFRFGWWYMGEGQAFTGSADMILGVRELVAANDGEALNFCPAGPYNFKAGSLDQQCDALHYWSLHSGGANFLFVDGSVRFLSYGADSMLPALATRAGGEVIPAWD